MPRWNERQREPESGRGLAELTQNRRGTRKRGKSGNRFGEEEVTLEMPDVVEHETSLSTEISS